MIIGECSECNIIREKMNELQLMYKDSNNNLKAYFTDIVVPFSQLKERYRMLLYIHPLFSNSVSTRKVNQMDKKFSLVENIITENVEKYKIITMYYALLHACITGKLIKVNCALFEKELEVSNLREIRRNFAASIKQYERTYEDMISKLNNAYTSLRNSISKDTVRICDNCFKYLKSNLKVKYSINNFRKNYNLEDVIENGKEIQIDKIEYMQIRTNYSDSFIISEIQNTKFQTSLVDPDEEEDSNDNETNEPIHLYVSSTNNNDDLTAEAAAEDIMEQEGFYYE